MGAGHGGLMVSTLGSRSSRPGSSPGLHCAGEDSTLTAFLSTHVYKWVMAKSMLGIALRWTCIPSSSMDLKHFWSLRTMETGIISGLMDHLARTKTLDCEEWDQPSVFFCVCLFCSSRVVV